MLDYIDKRKIRFEDKNYYTRQRKKIEQTIMYLFKHFLLFFDKFRFHLSDTFEPNTSGKLYKHRNWDFTAFTLIFCFFFITKQKTKIGLAM